MTEASHSARPIPLYRSGAPALGGAMLGTAARAMPPHTATTVIDLLDTQARVTRVDIAGITPVEARAALAWMWAQR